MTPSALRASPPNGRDPLLTLRTVNLGESSPSPLATLPMGEGKRVVRRMECQIN